LARLNQNITPNLIGQQNWRDGIGSSKPTFTQNKQHPVILKGRIWEKSIFKISGRWNPKFF
jgi:hypothetical protein